MQSEVSSEKPQALVVHQIAEQMRAVKEAGQKVLWVLGPAVVHTGAAPSLAALVRGGWVDVMFGGNAIATHDVEQSMYGTSLGRRPVRGQRRRARPRAPPARHQRRPRPPARWPRRSSRAW